VCGKYRKIYDAGIRAHTKNVKDMTLTVLNLTGAIGNEHPQIIFHVGIGGSELVDPKLDVNKCQ
jgi:hypothetical protein